MTEPISILIVDDHEVVRKGIRSYLDSLSDYRVVGEASTGEEAISIVEEFIPDVVLMDLIMPGMDGVETTRRIKKISPRTQVVVLTSFHEDSHIFPALKAGATSYILKDMKMDKLVESLKRAVTGEVTLHPLVARRVLQNYRGEDPEEQPLYAELSEREQEVLLLIANGLSNGEIAAKLVISENTVKGHVSNILSKLHLADRTQVAVFAWQKGIIRRD
jgi:NarL family two-component system response regulator LiaR